MKTPPHSHGSGQYGLVYYGKLLGLVCISIKLTPSKLVWRRAPLDRDPETDHHIRELL